LILSYIFIGAVPALLILSFFLLSANFASMNVSAYLFKDTYDDIVSDVSLTATSVAEQLVQQPRERQAIMERTQKTLAQRYRALVMALVPPGGGSPVVAGRWEHQRAPVVMPAWLTPEGFTGTAAIHGDDSGELQLVIRAVQEVRGPEPAGNMGWIVVDVPVDDFLLDSLRESTGVKALTPRFSADPQASTLLQVTSEATATPASAFFGNSVAFIDTVLWSTKEDRTAAISIRYDVQDLWSRLGRVQARRVLGTLTFDQLFLAALGIIAVLFLIIQGVALLMGLALARSITSSIHELFAGTERVRQGDFTHRITVTTKDQLGELAESFNQMTGSIEGLLKTAA
jgi:HAMP domain-containing protein